MRFPKGARSLIFPLLTILLAFPVLGEGALNSERTGQPEGTAPRSERQLKRAVRDLPADEAYPQWEIENCQSARQDGVTTLTEGAAIAGGGILGESPVAVITGTVMIYRGGTKIIESQKDLTKMERHNSQVQERRERDRFARRVEN